MHCNLIKAPVRPLLLCLAGFGFFVAPNQELPAQTLSTTSPVAQASSEWNRYSLKDHELSVLLPTGPAMSTYSSNDRFAKSQQRNVIGAYAGGVVYAILIFDVRQSLEEFIAEAGHSSSSDLTREVTVSGVRGKEYAFGNDTIRRVTQYFARDQRIYVFKAQGSRLGNPDVGISRFLESIRFERHSGGLAMVDGPGDPPSINTSAVDGSEARVLMGKEVTSKAVVFTKPEPTYTEDARRNEITGTVVLRCVFSSAGAVTNIRAVSGLPHGLTERAIGSARQIRFIPAIKDGRFVSMWIQLEYNFNLY